MPIISFLRRLFTSRANPVAMAAAKTKVQSIIDENAVGRLQFWSLSGDDQCNTDLHAAVFSKSYCPYCKASKQLLSESGAKAYIVEMDQVGQCNTF